MRFAFATCILVLACFPALAQPESPHMSAIQGNIAVVRGRVHIEKGAEGTFINIDFPGASRSIAGYISFGDEPTFRGLSDLEGRTVVISGMVVLDGRAIILMTDPAQLAVVN